MTTEITGANPNPTEQSGEWAARAYLDALLMSGAIDQDTYDAAQAADYQSVTEAEEALDLVGVEASKRARNEASMALPGSAGSDAGKTVHPGESRAEKDLRKAAEATASVKADIAAGVPVDPEEMALVPEEVQPEIAALIRTMESDDVNLGGLRWMFTGDVGLFGAPNEEMLMDLMEIAEGQLGINPDLFVLDNVDLPMEDRIRIGAQQFFSNKNDVTIAAATIWGQQNERWLPQEDRDAYTASQTLNVGWMEGKSILTGAAVYGIEPVTAINVYQSAVDRGIVSAPIVEGRRVVRGTGEPISQERIDETNKWSERFRPWMERHGYPDSGPLQTVDEAPYQKMQAAIAGQMTPAQMWNKFNSGMDLYGSELLATLSLESQDLANQLYNDQYSLTTEQLSEALDIVGGAEKWANTPGVAPQAAWLLDRMMGTRDVVKVDISGAKEAARTLAASWNMPELSEAQLNQIANGQVAANLSAIRASQGNPFKPEVGGGTTVINMPSPYAAAAESMRGTAMYQELFEHRRSGESEEEYAQRFDRSVSRFTGDSDPVLARVGMRSGDPETVGRNLMATGEGYENSTFMERLTLMGNAFKEAT